MEHQESEQLEPSKRQHLLMATPTSSYLSPAIKSNFERTQAKELIDQGKENQKHDQIERVSLAIRLVTQSVTNISPQTNNIFII